MSRAFVKDDDDRPERPLPRAESEHPNYVTPAGLERLRAALERARADGAARDVAYFERRIASAVLPSTTAAPDEVAFGVTVEAREPSGRMLRVRIVGEDEADPRHGAVSWTAPLAQALLGARVGDRVVVSRPAGAIGVTIERVEPPQA